jgi:hypothetical protein
MTDASHEPDQKNPPMPAQADPDLVSIVVLRRRPGILGNRLRLRDGTPLMGLLRP